MSTAARPLARSMRKRWEIVSELHRGRSFLWPVVKAMIHDPARVHCNTRIEKIRKDQDRWVVYDGWQERAYDRLVLAFPVMDAIKDMLSE